MRAPHRFTLAMLSAAAVAAAGCGSTGSSSSSGAAPSTATSGAASTPSGGSAPSSSSPGALSADATSAATGDIPDNQVFLVFHNSTAGYSMKFPEGWTRRGSGSDVTFQDKNNLVHVVVSVGAAGSPAVVAGQLRALRASNPKLSFTAPQAIRIGSEPAVKAVYTTLSAPNPVTGKQVRLIVDRYVLTGAGKHALVDLGTPQGVDNVDAYRMMIDSFRWS